jgi:hypothetical protein
MPSEVLEWSGLVGTVITILGFSIALVQLHKTQSAAVAAQGAAERTQHQAKHLLQSLATLSEMTDVAALCKQGQDHLKRHSLKVASLRFGDARMALAQVRGRIGSDMPETRWQELLTRIGALENALEATGKPEATSSEMNEATELTSRIQELVGRSVRKLESTDVRR